MCSAPDRHEPDPSRLRRFTRPALIPAVAHRSGSFRKTPGRLFEMAFIRLYQLTLPPLHRQFPPHMPTCSEYGYEIVARRPVVRRMDDAVSARRLLRARRNERV